MKISKELKTGILAVAAIGLLIWGFNFLNGKDVFSKERRLYAIYPRVEGLVNSNPIVINGLKIGQVESISFLPDYSGSIIVGMMINTDFPIPKNSTAHIFSADLMGSKSVAIQLGDAKILATDGDTLASSLEASLKDQVNMQVAPIKKKAEEMMNSVDSVLTALKSVFNKESRRNIAESFQSIRRTIHNIESTTYQMDTLMSDQSGRVAGILQNVESITANLNNNSESINRIINNMAIISDTLVYAELPQTFIRINETVMQMNSILTKINEGEGTIGLLINNDSLYYKLQSSSENLDRLLIDMKKNPERYVKFSIF